jgi:hypothetical protein
MLTKTRLYYQQTKTNYQVFEINTALYEKEMQDTVFLKFVKILKSKGCDIIVKQNCIIHVHQRDLRRVSTEYAAFKSICIKNRNNKKIKCACDDKVKCRILDCSCCCHDEEKFFNSDYHLNNLDKIRMCMQHYGPHALITRSFVESFKKNLTPAEITHVCDICKTFNNPQCRNCNLLVKYVI